MEEQASQIISRQLDRLNNYPMVEQRLRRHLEETRTQQVRLEQMLGEVNETYSGLKDFAMGFIGNMAALAHTPSPDELLKNSFANLAFENYEIAAYTALISMAEYVGRKSMVGPLTQSLAEERDMADWVHKSLPDLTTLFLSRSEAGQKADR